MHEFHLWLQLEDDTYESDVPTIEAAIVVLQEIIDEQPWFYASFTIENFNGSYFLRGIGLTNHRWGEAKMLDELVTKATQMLPGSYGLVYERNGETSEPPGPNAFRVRVIARGVIREEADPFLSPCNPTIED